MCVTRGKLQIPFLLFVGEETTLSIVPAAKLHPTICFHISLRVLQEPHVCPYQNSHNAFPTFCTLAKFNLGVYFVEASSFQQILPRPQTTLMLVFIHK